MRRDLTDQRNVFFFYLTVISYANSTCKVACEQPLCLGEKIARKGKGKVHEERRRRRRIVPPKFLSQRELCPGSVIKTFADERLLAGNLGISFFPYYRFGVAVKGNSFVLETYPRPRR